MVAAFPIDFRFRGGLTVSQRATFGAAAARWQKVIVAPLPAVKIHGQVTRGVIIEADGPSIDGPGGILGQAGPLYLRPNLPSMGRAAYLPSFGIMSFDAGDLLAMERDGTLLDVVTHEIGHVLGVGTVWRRKGLLAGAGTADPRFTGHSCGAECARLLPGATTTPVENRGGGGTRDSHFRESAFDTELMTGWVEAAGTRCPLSRLTVASMGDLGYTVDLSAAEPYRAPTLGQILSRGERFERPHCQTIMPIGVES